MVIKYGVPEKHINLQGGWPTPRLHPSEELGKAAARVFSSPDIDQKLRYGAGQGDAALRSHIASWLTDEYAPNAGPISPERILVSNGASNGLATILQKFADPSSGQTRTVWMVEPTYHLAAAIFRDAGFIGSQRIRAAPEGPNGGVDLAFLRAGLEESERFAGGEGEEEDVAQVQETTKKGPGNGYPKIYRHILYMVPTFSNPSGRTMAHGDRVELVRLAREFDVLLVTDDVYDVLRWSPGRRVDDSCQHNLCCCGGEEESSSDQRLPLPPRLVDIDRLLPGQSPFGNAVSNGSFSKIVAPGTRVGWMEGSPDFAATLTRVAATSSGGNQAHMSSLIIGELFAQGALQQHLHDVLIPTYQKRYRTLVSAVRHHLYPLGVRIAADVSPSSYSIPAGGFFLYILFPGRGPSVDDICSLALERFNLKIAPGRIFTVADDASESPSRPTAYVSGARLCWAWHEEDELAEGIERLAETLRMANSKRL